jgi:hypothetical protein
MDNDSNSLPVKPGRPRVTATDTDADELAPITTSSPRLDRMASDRILNRRYMRLFWLTELQGARVIHPLPRSRTRLFRTLLTSTSQDLRRSTATSHTRSSSLALSSSSPPFNHRSDGEPTERRGQNPLTWAGVKRRTACVSSIAHQPVMAVARPMLLAMVTTGSASKRLKLTPWPERSKSALNELLKDTWLEAANRTGSRPGHRDLDVSMTPSPIEARKVRHQFLLCFSNCLTAV